MENDIELLKQSLQHNLDLVQLLSHRVEMLESQVEENAGQRMAVMLLLRAVLLSSENHQEVAALAQRIAAQLQVQPSILLDGGKETLVRAKTHLDWMTAPDPARG
ncbi:hypothetical protein [Delftia sp. ZNC0008]|uniref:hypothetical protein n=1 Tax=Delftia sp. ZNC0008 TaxID=1339242 RepID=UPI00064679E3|nr:hypothetical protein [Delftia sp. ZNC0008]